MFQAGHLQMGLFTLPGIPLHLQAARARLPAHIPPCVLQHLGQIPISAAAPCGVEQVSRER